MKKIKILSLILILFISLGANAANEVQWSFNIKGDGSENPILEMTAKIASGFHLYSIDNPEGGGMPLTFDFNYKGCEGIGKITTDKKYTVAFNDIFEVNEHYYTGTVTFSQKLKPLSKDFSADVQIHGQVCDEGSCYQINESHTFKGKGIVKSAQNKPEEVLDKTPIEDVSPTTELSVDSPSIIAQDSVDNVSKSPVSSDKWWRNVEKEMTAFSNSPKEESQSLWFIFIAGFLGGLIALVTPCVWPMIPMTVSFFLKQNKSKGKAVKLASVYGASIIAIYVVLGLVITAIFGASALNEFATSAGFNVAFFILLVIFAISFMGGFEITLPSSWSNKIDSKVDSSTGYLSIFFMAFTLSLVSFSCTGPIIGTLLVEAASSSNFISPAVGMLGFAIALALPFTLFAMFPTLLKSAPKSGSWMNTVKVVLGFLELALALKFLSVADLAYGWRILDREVFISLWIVIFALLGVYLLGKIQFPHDSKTEKIGITRFLLACISFAFAIYMLPGLWGAPLKSISAFTPPVSTQDFNLYDGSVHASTDDFEEGLRMSQRNGKPVLLDFSGFGCVNCRKMEAAVWTDPKVKSTIEKDFNLVTLMVDDKTSLPEPIEVIDTNGKQRILRTVGDKWSYLQRTKFGSNAQPFYVVIDGDGKPLSGSYGYNENVNAYLKFLNDARRK